MQLDLQSIFWCQFKHVKIIMIMNEAMMINLCTDLP